MVTNTRRHPYIYIALSPGSSQFFNDARRKTREPGNIHHVHEEDSAIDQRVSVSEYHEGMIGGFKGERRAFRASAVRGLAQSCIER